VCLSHRKRQLRLPRIRHRRLRFHSVCNFALSLVCPRQPETALPTIESITTSFSLVEDSNPASAHHKHTHTHTHTHKFTFACCAAHAMKFSLPLLSALLLPLLAAASPTPTPAPSRALSARAAIISPPSATAPPARRDDKFEPSIPPLSLDLPTAAFAGPSIPSLSLDLPPETCTPGFSSYATPGLDGYVPAEACNALWVYFPNFAAAVAFSVLFGILTFAHLCQAVVYRNGFCWVIIMASLWETGAYAFRALGSKDQQSAGIATVAQILVLVAPICECQTEKQTYLLFLTSSC